MLSEHQHYKGDMTKIQSLFAHECKRVIEDRLINQEDIQQFQKYLAEALSKSFGDEATSLASDET